MKIWISNNITIIKEISFKTKNIIFNISNIDLLNTSKISKSHNFYSLIASKSLDKNKKNNKVTFLSLPFKIQF
jgi:hypothetical protein